MGRLYLDVQTLALLIYPFPTENKNPFIYLEP